jgi:hypothetical protein
MIKNDYILRMIEQMGVVMRKILNLENNQQYKQAHNEIDNSMKQLGVSRALTLTLPHNELMNLLGRPDGSYEDRCMILSRLIQADAHVYYTEGEKSTAYDLYQSSLGILTQLAKDEDSEKLPDIKNRISEVQFLMRDSMDL